MSLTKSHNSNISPRRLKRINEEVAPLYARGLTNHEIAEILGLSTAQIRFDVQYIKEEWKETITERIECARGELIAKHDYIYGECMRAYYESKKNSKFLELASKQLDSLGRLLGQAGPSINLHAHNHQHTLAVQANAVSDLFKPLDSAEYADMVAARVLPPADSPAMSEEELSNLLANSDASAIENEQPQGNEWQPAISASVNDNEGQQSCPTVLHTDDQEKPHKNRKVRHPRG